MAKERCEKCVEKNKKSFDKMDLVMAKPVRIK